jgi:predicted transcriptional regulator
MAKSLVELCADIVAAQVQSTTLSQEEISVSLQQVFQALQDLDRSVQNTDLNSPLPRDSVSSIQRHQVVCLECGRPFKLLANRHLALHGLTPRQYKRKHGIPMTQPLSSHTLSAKRRRVAKQLGMGKALAEWRAERQRPAR